MRTIASLLFALLLMCVVPAYGDGISFFTPSSFLSVNGNPIVFYPGGVTATVGLQNGSGGAVQPFFQPGTTGLNSFTSNTFGPGNYQLTFQFTDSSGSSLAPVATGMNQVQFPAMSFFDIFTDIPIPGPGGSLTNTIFVLPIAFVPTFPTSNGNVTGAGSIIWNCPDCFNLDPQAFESFDIVLGSTPNLGNTVPPLTPNPVPESTTWLLFGSGTAFLAWSRRRLRMLSGAGISQ